jgi:hypothetical protein
LIIFFAYSFIFGLIFLHQIAYFTFQELGIKVTVEKAKTLQARAYVKKALFSAWHLDLSGKIEIAINLTVLVQCLTIFGTGGHLEMNLQDEDGPLSLMCVLQ